MLYGIFGGITWALETVVLGIALSMTPFLSTEKAIFLAPFVSTFLHDMFSSIWACTYNGVRGNLKNVINALKTRDGKFVMLAALIGGPVGMTGYALTINNLGSGIGAVASAVYPAIGSFLAFLFLKEKMQWYRWILLLVTIGGVYGLSASSEIAVNNLGLGLLGVVMCAFGWGIEGVILAKCMKNPDVKNEYALQIRQTTSALFYAAVILPVLKGWGFTAGLFTSHTKWLIPTIALAAFFATVSYLCYYKAIATIGVSKAMALNITYAAWAVIFTVIILRDKSVITPVSVICTAVVIICGIFAATDFKELFSKRSQN